MGSAALQLGIHGDGVEGWEELWPIPRRSPTCLPTYAAAAATAAAKKVLIVPGYGLAVAGAQYSIADLVKGLRSKGITVK